MIASSSLACALTAPIRRVVVHVVAVTPKTRWTFVEVESASGEVGTGEATLSGREGDLVELAGRWADRLLDPAAPRLEALRTVGPSAELAEAAIRSALDQALWDLEARRARVPLAQALGGPVRERIKLYANVNRRTLDRTPGGFATSARDALTAGYDAVKIAPFDEVTPEARRDGRVRQAAAAGLTRIAAVRESIGPDRDLLVDCHWRLDEAATSAVIEACAELGVHWVECPLPETDDHLPALRRLRGFANDRGVRLAGCEEAVGVAGFEPFLKAGAYDVMMPDVKYVGGIGEMLWVADRLSKAGVEVSPHNPSGPIAHAASLHVSAAMPAFDRLEVQFDETPLFDALVGGGLPRPVDGEEDVKALGPGLGVALNLSAHGGLTTSKHFERTPVLDQIAT